MSDTLDLDDAGQISDLAGRARRAAATARRIAATDSEASVLLTDLADKADALVAAAQGTAAWIEEHRS